jgi:hypothetical protein
MHEILSLIPHVLPTVERARREFGDAAELTLTINDDPESYDPYLKMYISLPAYCPETMSRIDSIQSDSTKPPPIWTAFSWFPPITASS